MKKLALTIAIVLGMTIGASAQGGLFGKGSVRGNDYYERETGNEGPFLSLPNAHGYDNDASAPLGGGVLLLIGFGAAYAASKKRK